MAASASPMSSERPPGEKCKLIGRREQVDAPSLHGWTKPYPAVARPARSHELGPARPSLAPAVARVVDLAAADADAAAVVVRVEEAVATAEAAAVGAAAAAAAAVAQVAVLASTAAVAWKRAHSAEDGTAVAVGHAYGAWQRSVKPADDQP